MRPSPSKMVAILLLAAFASPAAWAASAASMLPLDLMNSGKPIAEPVNNAAFIPGPDAVAAPAFVGALKIAQTEMQTKPAVEHPMQDGRHARLFPSVTLEFFTMDGMPVPVQRGEMVRETASGKVPTYWRVIPQFGRVWKEKADGEWSRAAFPIMLVNDTSQRPYLDSSGQGGGTAERCEEEQWRGGDDRAGGRPTVTLLRSNRWVP